MAKQLNDWLDEFIEHGFDSEDITRWPEEGSEPIVVEELPQDPQFGKVYAIKNDDETTYYTVDVNGNWINLTEGSQTGGIVEVEYLSEATEPNVTYRVTIGDASHGPGLYYSMLDNSENLIFIYINDLNYIDSSGAVVFESGEVLKRANNNACYINIDGGEQSSDTYYPYDYTESSGVVNILDAIFPYSAQTNGGVFYLSSDDLFDTTSNYNTLIVPIPQGSYYEPVPVNSSGEVLVYDDGYNGIQYSSGANEIYWKHYPSDGSGYVFNGLQYADDIPNMLTDVFGSNDIITSGIVYYPVVNESSGQDYYANGEAFMALIAPQAHPNPNPGESGWIPDDYTWYSFSMEPDKTYTIRFDESGSGYYLTETAGIDYFTSEQDACDALRDSIDHEVSSGEVFDSIYYPTVSSGQRSYTMTLNDKNGIWLKTDDYDTGSSVDGQTVYGYYDYPLGFDNGSQRIQDSEICEFLTIAKTGKNGFDYIDDNTFWNRANRIFYPIDSSGTKYTSQEWTNDVANVILYHSLNGSTYDCSTWFLNSGEFAYIEFYSSGQHASINTISLPTTSTPVTVTINDVTYTITKNE